MSKIDCLCKTLVQDVHSIQPIGFIDDESWKHEVFPTDQWNCKHEKQSLITLRGLLSGNIVNVNGFRSYTSPLSVKEKSVTSHPGRVRCADSVN